MPARFRPFRPNPAIHQLFAGQTRKEVLRKATYRGLTGRCRGQFIGTQAGPSSPGVACRVDAAVAACQNTLAP